MRETSRIPIRRLYVLGAGASYAASMGDAASRFRAPLDNQFAKRIIDYQFEPPWIRTAKKKLLKGWLDPTPFHEHGLEEAILKQLSHVEFLGAAHPRRRRFLQDNHEFLAVVVHLISAVLYSVREQPSRPLKRIADSVIAQDDSGEIDAIITFNYDLLLDNHLLAAWVPSSVYFDRIRRSRSSRERPEGRFPSPPLLKLHGSVNWRCKRDHARHALEQALLDNEPYRIPEIWLSHRRPSLHDDEVPLIIPPLPSKPIMANQLFRFLWTRAYEYLMEAREICVCGYSLPQTDQMAMSLFGSFKSQRLRSVVIADPNPEMWRRWRSLFKRPGLPRRVSFDYADDLFEMLDLLEL